MSSRDIMFRLGFTEATIKEVEKHLIFTGDDMQYVMSEGNVPMTFGITMMGDNKLLSDFYAGAPYAMRLFTILTPSTLREEWETAYGECPLPDADKDEQFEKFRAALALIPGTISVAQIANYLLLHRGKPARAADEVTKHFTELFAAKLKPVTDKKKPDLDIKSWLASFEAPFVVSDPTAIGNKLTGEKFLIASDTRGLTDEELVEIGITKKNDRLVLLAAIASLPAPPPKAVATK